VGSLSAEEQRVLDKVMQRIQRWSPAGCGAGELPIAAAPPRVPPKQRQGTGCSILSPSSQAPPHVSFSVSPPHVERTPSDHALLSSADAIVFEVPSAAAPVDAYSADLEERLEPELEPELEPKLTESLSCIPRPRIGAQPALGATPPRPAATHKPYKQPGSSPHNQPGSSPSAHIKSSPAWTQASLKSSQPGSSPSAAVEEEAASPFGVQLKKRAPPGGLAQKQLTGLGIPVGDQHDPGVPARARGAPARARSTKALDSVMVQQC